MSNNFWDRDYVVEHLQRCPNDREWLEGLSTLDIVQLQDLIICVRAIDTIQISPIY
jgi:hypothetical protein